MACDQANIDIATFETYVRNDQTLQAMYIDAERRGYDALADALLEPMTHKVYGESNPQAAKVVSDNIKWLLGKRDQKRFGEKIEIKHEITLDRAITEAMDAARKRAMGHAVELSTDEYVALPSPTAVVGEIVDVLTDDDELMAELLS